MNNDLLNWTFSCDKNCRPESLAVGRFKQIKILNHDNLCGKKCHLYSGGTWAWGQAVCCVSRQREVYYDLALQTPLHLPRLPGAPQGQAQPLSNLPKTCKANHKGLPMMWCIGKPSLAWHTEMTKYFYYHRVKNVLLKCWIEDCWGLVWIKT